MLKLYSLDCLEILHFLESNTVLHAMKYQMFVVLLAQKRAYVSNNTH